ncbi:MAG: STAS domain-containing protein [Candidatus Hinthialibacter antarcticus]|nr:STAS domain-containing protein [Candidatus Hinthialibacter antarcticus]
MRITRREQDQIQIIEMSGDLGKNDSNTLKSLLEQLVESSRHFIILDIEQVRFIDSAMVLVMLRMKREALAAGGSIKLLRPRASVKRFLSIGQVLQLFECFETKIEAIRSFDNLKRDEKLKKQGLDIRNPRKTAASIQQKVLMQLLEILAQKGYLENEAFMQELYRSSNEVLDVYRKELEERHIDSNVQPS